VTVRVREHGERGRVFHGAGADPDIIVASAKAYLRALNRIVAADSSARTNARAWHAEAS
jgi:hypothetical protein